MDMIDIFLILLGIILGVVIGYFIVRNTLTKRQQEARTSAEHIINEAKKQGESLKKEKLLEAKEENPMRKEMNSRHRNPDC